MSAAAVETMDSSARPGELRTWRDAVTPLSRSSRRRWAVAYALLLVLGGVVVAGASSCSMSARSRRGIARSGWPIRSWWPCWRLRR